MRVGLFDSGMGGINVLKELINKYPHNHYVYYGDTKNLPYGDKSIDELMQLSQKIIQFLCDKQVDLIIIACGTVSSSCYQRLKEQFSIPIYDIISPTIHYLEKSSYKNIGVIGTVRTITSGVFNLSNKKMIMRATPLLVPWIEKNMHWQKKELIKQELMFFKKVDALVLGCTHYPLINDIIHEALTVDIIDMGKCLVRELNLDNDTDLTIELYFSKLTDLIKNNVALLLHDKYTIDEKIIA